MRFVSCTPKSRSVALHPLPFAGRRGSCTLVNLTGYPVLLCGSHLSRRLQCPPKEWVFGLFGQCNQLATIRAVNLQSISDSVHLLPKNAGAARAPNLDFVVHRPD